MDYPSLLTALTGRASLPSNSSTWSSCVLLTSSLLDAIREEESLSSSVISLRETTSRLEEELNSNTEYAQRRRELQALERKIADLESDGAASDSVIAALSTEIGSLDERSNPLRSHFNSLTTSESELSSIVAGLDSATQTKADSFTQSREIHTDFTRRNTELEQRESGLVERLLRLREREVDLRNSESTAAPTAVDVSAMLCPLPRASDGAALDIDPLLDTTVVEESHSLERLRYGTPLKRHADSVTCLSFSATQPMLASGSEDTVVSVLRTDTWQMVMQLTEARGSIMSVAFSPSNQLLLSASWDHAVRVYRLGGTAASLAYNCKDHQDCVYDAQFLSDDQFVSCSRDQTIRLFDIRRMGSIETFTSSSRPLSISSLQGGSLIVTSHFDGSLRGWDFRAKSPPFEVKVHRGTAGHITAVPGMMQMVSFGTDDRLIIASDFRSKNILGKVSHRLAVSREKVQFALWGGQAVIGGQGGEVCSYDLTSFKLKNTIKNSDDAIYCVAGKQSFGVAVGDQAGMLRFWFQ
jgi:WD40 repeat protein